MEYAVLFGCEKLILTKSPVFLLRKFYGCAIGFFEGLHSPNLLAYIFSVSSLPFRSWKIIPASTFVHPIDHVSLSACFPIYLLGLASYYMRGPSVVCDLRLRRIAHMYELSCQVWHKASWERVHCLLTARR